MPGGWRGDKGGREEEEENDEEYYEEEEEQEEEYQYQDCSASLGEQNLSKTSD